jgi:SHS2 domain-containing protein
VPPRAAYRIKISGALCKKAATRPDGILGKRSAVATTAAIRKLYVDDLVTSTPERSRGVGAALMTELASRANALGRHVLDLDSGVQRGDAPQVLHALGSDDHVVPIRSSRPLTAAFRRAPNAWGCWGSRVWGYGYAVAASGNRRVPHTADVRIEAWAPTREGCLVEAVRGLVDSFADTSGVLASGTYEAELVGYKDERLLAAVLDEVIYLVDTTDEVPIDVMVEPTQNGARLRMTTATLMATEIVGATPKGISLHELRMDHTARGWICAVTVDV